MLARNRSPALGTMRIVYILAQMHKNQILCLGSVPVLAQQVIRDAKEG